jgi:hypothetical protein
MQAPCSFDEVPRQRSTQANAFLEVNAMELAMRTTNGGCGFVREQEKESGRQHESIGNLDEVGSAAAGPEFAAPPSPATGRFWPRMRLSHRGS